MLNNDPSPQSPLDILLLLSNNGRKKLEMDLRALDEWLVFPKTVRDEFIALFTTLSSEGRLFEPDAKKLTHNLFELRVRHQGQWRATYAYLDQEVIIILSFFRKQTQKTPKNELKKALKRLNEYQEAL